MTAKRKKVISTVEELDNIEPGCCYTLVGEAAMEMRRRARRAYEESKLPREEQLRRWLENWDPKHATRM